MASDPGTDRDKALDVALGNIEKQFGKGALMRLGDQAAVKVAAIPTGALSLDLALGIGGVPRGRVIELYGPESSGKSSLALHIVAEAQRAGGIAAFIDAEHALDPTYARAIGVDINDLLVSQPDNGEQALEIADMLIRSAAVDVIVVDSVAALTPRAELEGEMGDTHVGLQARLMSQALRKLAGSLSRSKTSAIFINQLREKVGVMFGSPETTPGGRALKFYSSVRLDIRRIETLKDGTDAVGNRVRVKVVKNKCVAAGTRVFDPDTGLTHRIEDIVDEGVGTSVWAADKRGKMHVRPIGDRFDQGEQDVIGLHLQDSTNLWVTSDHKILTEHGWRHAGQLAVGDRVARVRRTGNFGDCQPVPPDHARMLGYLIGDGYVGGKTPIAFINERDDLKEDARRIANSLGCKTRVTHDGLTLNFSHYKGEKNQLLDLCRWAGIWGHLAPTKKIPAALLAADVSAEVLGNLLFGIWESDGWISREQTGAVRCGFATTSEQLAWQLHWLLLRFEIGSSVSIHEPGSRRSVIDGRRIEGKLPCWQVRIGGIDNVHRFAASLPMWGPRGRKLTEVLDDPSLAKHRGSRRIYLSEADTEPVLEYLRQQGLTAVEATAIIDDEVDHSPFGMRQTLGSIRLRRDRLAKLADALDSDYLHQVLEDELWYDRITAISPAERRRTFDIEVDELHNFVADGVVVHNCASPFRQAEFDILYGEGISKEGALLDIGVDEGIVRKAGAWYTYEGEQLGQGRENARTFLKEHDDVAREIEKRVKEKVGIEPAAADEQESGDGDALELEEG